MPTINLGKLILQQAAKRAAIGRVCGTKCNGKQFPNVTVAHVWAMGILCGDVEGDEIRMDACGSYMLRSHYGHRTSQYAWEVDHILPIKRGGTDDLWNLQPLQRRNNRSKADKFTAQWRQVLSHRRAVLLGLR